MYSSNEVGDSRPNLKIDKNILNHIIYGTLETKLCRICLTDNGEDFQSIFDTNYSDNGETWTTFRIIKEICQIEYEVELAGVVCGKCVEDARRAHELMRRVRTAECTIQTAVHALYLHAHSITPNQYRGGEMLVLKVARPDLEREPPKEEDPWKDEPIVKEEQGLSEEEKGRRSAMCHVCGVHLTSSRFLQRHLERKHAPVQSFTCHVCGRVLKTRRSLELHVARHGGKTDTRRFICDYCGAQYVVRGQLEQHIWGIHFDRRPFVCTQCGKGFRTMGTLRGHAAVHARLRDHICGVCGRGFVDARALVLHERLHSGERPFACEVCGRAFVSAGRRNAHTITSHTAPAHRCSLCPALFHLRSMVNTHMRKVHLRVHKRRRRGFAYKQVKGEISAI